MDHDKTLISTSPKTMFKTSASSSNSFFELTLAGINVCKYDWIDFEKEGVQNIRKI